jgi:hypothetical protein
MVSRASTARCLVVVFGLAWLMAGDLWGAPFGARPLAFEENRGQTDSRVRFLSRGDGYGLFLTLDEAVLSLHEGNSARTLRLRWEGAAPAPRVAGEGELPGKSHYLVGNDPAKWRTGIASYQKVQYKEIYPGIDLVFYGNPRQLEYDFVLAPGADPRTVRLAVEGADRMEIDPAGDLVLHLGGGDVRLKRPVSYQESGGFRREVASGWRRLAGEQVGFQVASYDSSLPLVIDPVLVYSTYLGGSSADQANDIAVDSAGNAYVTGFTRSLDFPLSVPKSPSDHPFDAFVTKLSPSGAVLYSTYFGGLGSTEEGFGIAVDKTGHAYVTGSTGSSDFPLVNPLPVEFQGNSTEVFVTKLDPSGAALVYSTKLGAILDQEEGRDIAVDFQGNAYVVGITFSPDFPTVAPLPYPSDLGLPEGFVAKLSPSGSSLLFCTLLGGSSYDDARGVAVDAAGNAYVTGMTWSGDFPTVNAFQGSLRSASLDAFVAKLTPDGSALLYSTFLGGSLQDLGDGIAVDAGGSVAVSGLTYSPDFPVLRAFQPALHGPTDAFVTRLSPAGQPLYSTFLGGSGEEGSRGIAVDGLGAAFLTGFTRSTDFPLRNPVQAVCGAGEPHCYDAFVTVLNPQGSAIVHSTYLGGGANPVTGAAGANTGEGIAVDSKGNAYVAGWTSTTDFPTVNAFQSEYGGGVSDAFVAKTSFNQPPACSAAFASPATLWPANGKLAPIAIRGVTDPDGDPLTLKVTGVRQDEPLGNPGTPDALGIGTSTVQLRSDRDGRGDGRVYRVAFEASDGNGGVCTGTVAVCVPHDQGRGRTCGDGGGLFDSNGSGR